MCSRNGCDTFVHLLLAVKWFWMWMFGLLWPTLSISMPALCCCLFPPERISWIFSSYLLIILKVDELKVLFRHQQNWRKSLWWLNFWEILLVNFLSDFRNHVSLCNTKYVFCFEAVWLCKAELSCGYLLIDLLSEIFQRLHKLHSALHCHTTLPVWMTLT